MRGKTMAYAQKRISGYQPAPLLRCPPELGVNSEKDRTRCPHRAIPEYPKGFPGPAGIRRGWPVMDAQTIAMLIAGGSPEYPLELLEFDEIAALTRYADRKAREAISERITLLTSQGRALGS